MKTILITDVSILVLLMLIYSLFLNKNKIFKSDFTGNILNIIMIITLGVTVLEIILHSMLGNVEFIGILELLYMVYLIGIELNIVSLTLFLYYFVSKKELTKKKVNKIVAILVFCILSLVIINIKTSGIYYIDDNAMFNTGKFAFLLILMTSVTIYVIFYIIRDKKSVITTLEKVVVIILCVANSSASIVQAFIPNTVLVSPILTLTLITIFNMLSNRITTADALTGAINRVTLNNILDNLQMTSDFAIASVDMDDLKIINDTYGHSEGDFALTGLVRVVNTVIKTPDVIARIGGDEFVIVFNTSNENIIEGKLAAIEEERKRFNQEANKQYELKFSISYQINDGETFKSAQEVLKTADNKMYAIKFAKKKKIDIRNQF